MEIRIAHISGYVFCETGLENITGRVIDHPGVFHVRKVDPFTGDSDLDGVPGLPRLAAAELFHVENDRRAWLSLHLGSGLAGIQPDDGQPVYRRDFISAFQPSLACRGVLVWFIDDNVALLRGFVDDGSDTPVGLADHELKIVIVLLRNIDGIRIERLEHRIDAGLLNSVNRKRVNV